jgi:hypothetical protein
MKDVKLHVGMTGRDSWIEVDGERLECVSAVEIKVGANEFSEVTIKMVPNHQVDVEIEPGVWEKAIAEANG